MLAGRVLSGALVGSVLGRGPRRRSAIAVAAASALAATYASYWLRRAANERLPDSVTGLLEDALVLGAGAALAASARRSATRATFDSASDLAGALRRAELAHGEHEKGTGQRDASWPDWYAAYMVAEQSGEALPS
jgi:hypothetical protein